VILRYQVKCFSCTIALMCIHIEMGQALNISYNKNSYCSSWKFWPEQSEEKKNTEEILAYTDKELGCLFFCCVGPSYQGIFSCAGPSYHCLEEAGRAACSPGLRKGAGKRREFASHCCYTVAIPAGLVQGIPFKASSTGPRSLCLKQKTKRELN